MPATAQPATTSPVDVRELVALFVGDDLSTPCHSDLLAFELCRRLRPSNVTALRLHLYGDWPAEAIEDRAKCALAVGFSDWAKAGRPD